MRKLALFKRFPKIRYKPNDDPIIQLKDREPFDSSYGAEFTALENMLSERYHELDGKALQMQNQFRRQQVILVLGGATITILGAIQAASSQSMVPGIFEAIIAGCLTIFTYYVRESKTQETYLDSRLKAEELRGECYLFLAQVWPYNEPSLEKRKQLLDKRVDNIVTGKGNA